MWEYVLYVGTGVFIAILALLFKKWRKPPKKVEEGVSEVEFPKGEGPMIEYDRGLGGSPYKGRITTLKKHGELYNATILDEDGTELILHNLDVSRMGNVKVVSSVADLMHKNIKLLSNKDSTGEIKVNPDGTVWSSAEKTDNAVLANLMAERRSYSKALKDADEFRQLSKLRAPSFYAEHLEGTIPTEQFKEEGK